MTQARRTRALTVTAATAGALVLTASLGVVALPDAAASGPRTVVTVSPSPGQGRINPMLLGGNGRWAYDNFGAWNPATQRAYPDYVHDLRASGVTSVRFPGGTIANLYHWQQAIGPVADRVDQVHGSPASFEPLDNDFGPDEYGAMTDRLGQRGIVVVNFSTGTPREAANWVEYMTGKVGENRNGGIDWAARRAQNGHPKPYDIRYWEVGNEMSLANQLYWRAGSSDTDPTTLYARGGSAAFTKQLVAKHSDYRDSAGVSDGTPDQAFVVKYAPVTPGTAHLYVGDQQWQQTSDLAHAAAGATVFTLDDHTGRIRFGDGEHGAVPAKGSSISISYTSGPHPGFSAFYAAMKRADPQAQVCAGLSGVPADQEFARLMGSKHPYDCVEQHAYVDGPADTDLPADEYYGELLQQTSTQVGAIRQIQQAITQYAGTRAAHVKVVASEYGQLGNAHPDSAPDFHAGLGEAVFMADDLAAFIRLGLPVADKSNLTDFVTKPAPGGSTAVGAPLNAMIAGPGPNFQLAPTGLVPRIMRPLAGSTALGSAVTGNPGRTLADGSSLPALVTVAARSHDRLELLVINQDPHRAVRAVVHPAIDHRGQATSAVLDGPSITARNRPGAQQVTIATSHLDVGSRNFAHTFPPHSITRIDLTAAGR